ncbi:MAG: hypothetical protein KGK08_08025 [Acidobacteriota bacterium]|nr:hypothetical protein [Acidobacteriota bacterium]
MLESFKLDPEGIDAAANTVFCWLSLYLLLAAITLWKIVMPATTTNSAEAPQDSFSDGVKIFTGIMIVFGLFSALAASADAFRLAITFPLWGTLLLLLILLILWIITRWFFLNRDDAADYTLDATERESVNKKWARQALYKSALKKQLVAWFCGDVVAIVWLMQLTHRGLTSLNFFNY